MMTKGSIYYEKRMNVKAVFKQLSDDDIFYLQYFNVLKEKSNIFQSFSYIINFNEGKCLYYKDENIKYPLNFQNYALSVYMNISDMVQKVGSSDSLQSAFTVFDQKLKTTIPKSEIIWRITSETKQINGYSCRRANGLLNHSVYVVAFFCPSIPLDIGPSVFEGLPGAILELHIPDEHISWFTVKIEPQQTPYISNPKTQPLVFNDFLTRLKTWVPNPAMYNIVERNIMR